MGSMITLTIGDARDLASGIPNGSVDIVFTDPPYPKEYLPLYEWLARESARVLKPGGWLFAYGAGEHLPDHLARMGEYLDYFWVFALLHGGATPRMWYKKLMSDYKPVMVYTKGKPVHTAWMPTVHRDRRDKRFHEWGQGIRFPVYVIDKLCPRDGIVWDPFVGGGTTMAACKILDRSCVAFEKDEATAEIARLRLETMQAPLPGMSVAQGHLFETGV